MYKIFTTTIPAAGTLTPIVVVPGQLIGVGLHLDVAANATLRLIVDEIVVNARLYQPTVVDFVPGTIPAFFYVPNAPRGGMRYRLTLTTAQTTERTVHFYYEDTPTL